MSAQEIMNDCREKMDKAIESTKHKFASIRAGRASVSMLDGIKVEQYGSEMPLNQVANVSAPEARLLVIDPWDKSIMQKIEKTIMLSNLGLTPNNDGKIIRLQIPELTAERRKEYVKLAKTEAENGKIAIRNVRKDANNHLRRLEKDGDITQDELKSFEDDTQKITDDHIKLVDDLLKKKEKEITTV
ncbi:ribosome recycling factor [uncultured Ilyobacter sp.]|jgi:ribosome recycling factor|uniref:ribosome recycling factor n=1 Tax=uncultured Ilyobacter sp. TaxID=544433 RepID=UPI0029C002E7|nr:ribosome recycling factor [uncultured Ilyobacter sp.]